MFYNMKKARALIAIILFLAAGTLFLFPSRSLENLNDDTPSDRLKLPRDSVKLARDGIKYGTETNSVNDKKMNKTNRNFKSSGNGNVQPSKQSSSRAAYKGDSNKTQKPQRSHVYQAVKGQRVTPISPPNAKLIYRKQPNRQITLQKPPKAVFSMKNIGQNANNNNFNFKQRKYGEIKNMQQNNNVHGLQGLPVKDPVFHRIQNPQQANRQLKPNANGKRLANVNNQMLPNVNNRMIGQLMPNQNNPPIPNVNNRMIGQMMKNPNNPPIPNVNKRFIPNVNNPQLLPHVNNRVNGQLMANNRQIAKVNSKPMPKLNNQIRGMQNLKKAKATNINPIQRPNPKDAAGLTILQRDFNSWNHADHICQKQPTNMANIDVPTPLGNVQIHGSNTQSFDTESANERIEMKLLAGFQSVVSEYPRALVIDVGSGYGVYTVMAARMGHLTVAIEPNVSLIPGLCTTIKVANPPQNVIIANMKNNVQNHQIQKPDISTHGCTDYLDLNALAEITSLHPHEDIIIRISPRIKYAEEVILCARRLFHSFKLKVVIMPWIKSSRRDAKNILKMFSGMKMSPYEPDTYQEMLNSAEMSEWPNIVMWQHAGKS